MNDIRGAVVYAAIMATIGTLKDECNKYDDCEGCKLKDDNGRCLLNHCPDRYDLDKIDKAIESILKDDNTPDEYQ